MLVEELRDILRELLAELGAISAEITLSPEDRSGVPATTRPLGGGGFLRLETGARTRHGSDIEASLDRTIRALRSARRRWEEPPWPELALTGGSRQGDGEFAPKVRAPKTRERISIFLAALANLNRVENAVLLQLRGTRGDAATVTATGKPLSELEASRWPFIVRRLLAQPKENSSHVELADPDFFAMTFYVDAVLIMYAAPPYAVDFIRHRARQVARELSALLPSLEPEPTAPAALAPRP